MPQESHLRHLMTLCHEADCCPEVYHDESAGNDCCVIIRDDYGNTAAFDPVDVLYRRPISLGDQICLRDAFDGEVYMQPEQYSELSSGTNRELLHGIALQRGLVPAGSSFV